jgi:hypothetical protein
MSERLATRSMIMIGIALFSIGIATAYKIWG